MSLKDPDELGHWKRSGDEREFRRIVDELVSEVWPSPPEQRRVEGRYGTAVVHVVEGTGAGYPVVLLPGFGAPALMYRPELVAELGGRRAFLVETIGDVGPSEQTAPISDASDEAGWLDDVLDGLGLGLGQAHLVGASFGGWLALNHGLRSPTRARSISGIEPVFARVGLRMALRSSGALLALLAPGPLRRRLASRWHQPLLADRRLQRMGRLAFTRHVNGHPRPDFLDDDQLGRVVPPTLILLGEQSELHRAGELAERLHRAMPHATVQLVPDAGHSLPVEHPELVGTTIAAFLDTTEHTDARTPS